MSHDFARSQRLKKESARKPARKKKGGVPSWLWLLVGTLVGCLIMFLVYLSGAAPQLPNLKSAPQPVVQPEQKTSEPAAPPKRVSPVFEFYTKLPEGGQPVTDIAPEILAPTTPVTPPVPAEAGAPDPIQQLLAEKEAAAKPESVKPEAKVEPKLEPKPEPVKPALAKPSVNGQFLQAGVFRNKAEVDKLKARIALLGMKPTVQSVTNAKGETLQKVLVGPFSSMSDMDDAKIILTGNGVNTIPVK